MSSAKWKQLWTSVQNLWGFESERNYADECSRRSTLTDDEFLAMYYPSPDTRRDIPIRVRRFFAEQFGFDKIIPRDCPTDILQDVDMQVILDELAEEFSVDLVVGDLPNGDESFDSIVRLINSRCRK